MATDNRSGLKDFIASISTIKGDLSNITAPPFLLANQSTVQFPSYWAENPPLFVAPAKESDSVKRTVLVLKWFLAALKRQQYAGRDPSEGVKKPLNAFLGEVFLAKWEDDEGLTRIVSEQVSHHPPITACYLWNEQCGIQAEGFACQSITFSGSVNIKQMGYAIIHIDKYDEDYLIPLPHVKVSGLLTGTPYPEITGTYSIVSSSGHVADIDFSGKRLLGLTGKKNAFHASVYDSKDTKNSQPLYTAEGTWSERFTIRDERTNTEVESYNYDRAQLPSIQTEPLEQQDPWESQRAWNATTNALQQGDMQAAVDAKSTIEEGQRAMRTEEQKGGGKWNTIFFRNETSDPVYSRLAAGANTGDNQSGGSGFWKYNFRDKGLPSRPFRGTSTPEHSRGSDGKARVNAGSVASDRPALDHSATIEPPPPSEQSLESTAQLHPNNADANATQRRDDQTRFASPYSKEPVDSRVNALVRKGR